MNGIHEVTGSIPVSSTHREGFPFRCRSIGTRSRPDFVGTDDPPQLHERPAAREFCWRRGVRNQITDIRYLNSEFLYDPGSIPPLFPGNAAPNRVVFLIERPHLSTVQYSIPGSVYCTNRQEGESGWIHR